MRGNADGMLSDDVRSSLKAVGLILCVFGSLQVDIIRHHGNCKATHLNNITT